jgi:hypothetical protein
VLYTGTEHALFVSVDRGRSWSEFAQLPTTLYDDLLIHPREHDLIVATHGRSILILDDVRPLALWSAAAASPAHLFPVRPATAFHYWKDTSYRGQAAYAGENPPDGAILTYWVGVAAPAATLTIANADGRVIRTIEANGTRGLHRTTWDLRHEPPPARAAQFGGGAAGADDARDRALPRPPHDVGPRGPFVAPGTYTATLSVGAARATQSIVVRGDPLMPHITDAMHRTREEFLVRIADMQQRVDTLAERAQRESPVAARLNRLRGRLSRMASDFNGSGVRPGTMHPPTETHQRLAREAEAELEEIARAMEVEGP